jgi:lysyl-tRNA synthetase class 2
MSDQPDELPEQLRVRREKLDRLRAAGADPYPVGFPRTATAAGLQERYAGLPPDTAAADRVGVTGRVVLNRPGGKLCFATLRDGAAEIQLMLSADHAGAEALAAWKADVDLGDLVGAEGEVVRSRRGELSVRVDRWAFTAKALRPLPDKHKGLHDPEARVRRRYVDLIVNPAARQLLETRARVVGSLRRSLSERGFLEVETPMLHPVRGGATARPFSTRMNALDIDLFLRIAPELYLKRLMVGGLERVFELNRNFRNEGMDATHNPEFTMLEVYEAYGDYDTMAELTRSLVVEAAEAAIGRTVVPDDRGGEIDLAAPWRSVTVHEAVSAAVGHEVTADTGLDALRKRAGDHGVALQPGWVEDEVVLELYEKLVEPEIVAPTFVRDFPARVRPLARAHRKDPRLTETWDLVVRGLELGPAFSELTDPVEQRRRLVEQARLGAGGDPEAMALDEDFLRALEYGMPPLGGMGMGIDRLVMVLTGIASIRETVTFPLVRPE